MTGWDRASARDRLIQAIDVLTPRSPLPDLALDRFLELCELLSRWASRVNLTAHRSPEAILERLVLDALALDAAVPTTSTLADLGTGAGFPGLPFAIARPERRVTLVEARERKHHFQREAVRVLGLENAVPVHGRAESVPASPHQLVLSQAMAKPQAALPLLLRWAASDGWLAIPGGSQPPQLPATPEVPTTEVRRYRVPLTGVERCVWIGRRAAECS
jgi:16S rRNA (guanine527-N7)-methyltransferase